MRKFATIIAALAAAPDLRMAGVTPVASFTLAGTLSEVNAEGEAVAVPFFQSCEAWGNDALRIADIQPGTMLMVTGKPELNAYVAKGQQGQAAATPAAPPRPGQTAARTATTTGASVKKEIRIRADTISEAFVAADLITDSNGSVRSDFGVSSTMLTGRLVDDVTVKDTKGGLLVYGRVAVDDYVRRNGQSTKMTDFYDFKVWREAGAMVADGKKGDPITLMDGTWLVNRSEKDGVVTRYPYIQARQAYLGVKQAKAADATATADAEGAATQPAAAQATEVADAPEPAVF